MTSGFSVSSARRFRARRAVAAFITALVLVIAAYSAAYAFTYAAVVIFA